MLVFWVATHVSYELNENLDYSIISEFERVYLMADFDAKVIRFA